jgi:replicative DNA helicase
MTTPRYEFDEEFQRKVVALMLRDTKFATRTNGLIQPEYFTNDVFAALASVALDYYSKYHSALDRSIVPTVVKKAVEEKKIRKDLVDPLRDELKEILVKVDLSDADFVADEISTFARHSEIQNAIIKSVDLLERRDYEKISQLITKANLVGLDEDTIGIDFFEDVERRTKERVDVAAGLIVKTGITTGFEDIDKQLYHGGWGRKELSALMGPPKSGKSGLLAEFAKNASLAGYNVLYVSCEVAAKIIIDRLDSNLSSTMMTGLKLSAKTVEEKLEEVKTKHKYGRFIVREYPSGRLKVSELRRLIERAKAASMTFDLIVVDYADIMCPERNFEDFREGMRNIYIDLRAIASEYDCAVLTATQTNREGAKAATPKGTDVAEDFNKLRTVDVLIAIAATEAERAAGEARLVFTANRNGPADVVVRVAQDRKYLRFLKKVLSVE